MIRLSPAGNPLGRGALHLAVVVLLLAAVAVVAAVAAAVQVREMNWDEPKQWETSADGKSDISLSEAPGWDLDAIEIAYDLKGGGWAQMKRNVAGGLPEGAPVVFWLKAESSDFLEVKFVDGDGSNFVTRIDLAGEYPDWKRVVVYRENLEYGWGGDNRFDGLRELYFAVSGSGKGKIWLDETGIGKPGLKTTLPVKGPVIDPNADLPGYGFPQRRDRELAREEPLVLEWLKHIQDTSSPDRKLVPSMEDNMAQTFNNALVAMAFVLKGERERAERILDFYAAATVTGNTDLTLQNFFYGEEPRGFYQTVLLQGDAGKAYHDPGRNDRWIGDMAWLLIACKYYEKTYESPRYEKLGGLLKDLLVSFYKREKTGGYVQHGWRRGDGKLHEGYGHHEGNIDCYAALTLSGEHEYAAAIKRWLEAQVDGKDNLPLDLYTWRVLAYGKDYAGLLAYPERDLRYRKTLQFGDRNVAGFYHSADPGIQNIWVDGNGHMSCAYFAAGDPDRGNFYANQMDAFLMDRPAGAKTTKAFPYTLNREGGFEWVDFSKGFVSCAAWYIFAKNRFNPFSLETCPDNRQSGTVPRVTVTASSHESDILRPSNAFDGDPGTRWSSNFSDPQWLAIDFGSEREVAGLCLRWESAYAKAYSVQVSRDGNNWEPVFATTAGDGGTDELFFSPRKTRFVRVMGSERATTWGYSLWEVEVKGPEEMPSLRSLSRGKGGDPELAMDGNPQTFWSSGADGEQWLEIDFGKEKALGGVEIHWGDEHAAAYGISGSVDGRRWESLSEVPRGNGGRDTLYFRKTNLRYLRITASRSAAGKGYKIGEILVKGPDEAATPQRMYELAAAESQAGYYPGWLTKQQKFWTITGADEDTEESLVSEDGVVEPFSQSYTLTPFLFTGGRLISSGQARVSQTLEKGYLPIPTVAWDADGIGLSETVFTAGGAGKTATFVRIAVSNGRSEPASGNLFLSVRPFQINPPWQFGGTSEIASLRYVEGGAFPGVLINGRDMVISLMRPDGFGARPFAQGDIVHALEEGKLPDARELNDPARFASGAFSFSWDLGPGERKDFVFVVPLHHARDIVPGVDGEPSEYFSRRLAGTVSEWEQRLAGPVFDLPEPALTEALRSNLAYILVNRDQHRLKAGSRNYKNSWMRDGSVTSAALLRLGYYREVREYLDWMCSLQHQDGMVPFMVDQDRIPEWAAGWKEYDSQGQLVYAIYEYYRFTGDRKFLEEKFACVEKALRFLADIRKKRLTPEYRDGSGAKRAMFGILPESNSHEGYFPAQHSYWDDYWAIKGFKDGRDIAKVLKRKDAYKWIDHELEGFRAALSASLRLAMETRSINYLPGCVEKGDFDATSTAVALYPCGELQNLPMPQTRTTFRKYYDETFLPRTKGPWKGAFTPYEIRNAGAFLMLGERDIPLEMLRYFLSVMRPRPWNHLAEVVFSEYRHPQYIGDMPHTWIGAEFIIALRNLLVLEDGETLVIGAGIDPGWAEQPGGFNVDNLPTYFGLISFRACRENEMIRIELSGDADPSGGIRLQLPAAWTGGEIRVNGKRPAPVRDGELRIRRLPARIDVTVKRD